MALGLLAATHFLVDVTAGTISPLWPGLEESLHLREGGLLWVTVCWSVTNSFGQLFFALWSDRRPSPYWIWVGPLLAILSLSCIGLAGSSIGLAGLFILGGLGVAAFHPEAAATAGSLFPANRSRAMAIFALCGYLGQSVGPYYSGQMVDKLGFRGLLWGIAWGAPILFMLWLGLRRMAPGGNAPAMETANLESRKVPFGMIALLLVVGASRILPALGVPLALAYLLKEASASTAVVGAAQSAFMGGIGFGAMACAAFLRPQWERTALWIFPLLAAPVLASLGFVSDWTLVYLVALAGLLLGVTMPVYIAYGQQILPHGQRVASSITMGVSWGISGAIVPVVIGTMLRFDVLPSIFWFFMSASLLSSCLCHLLPRREIDRVRR
ncbi:Fosmidomycin resistance protein [Lignipirellula cremea]|uniref:Fosmidomycin resistance protein n=2 Tax=Lignipirellula cremea TaxID=2528010 RepID=A0A518DNS1_9BACT|nr:Fosmidomycin resistance protein [Lignipirellula cremea]